MDFSSARPTPAERMPGISLRDTALQASFRRSETLLEAFQSKAGTGLCYSALSGNKPATNPFEKFFLPAAAALAQATVTATTTARATKETGSTIESAVRLLRPLIGLGEGLTPTGDDFVTGYLAALRARVAADGAGNKERDPGITDLVEALGAAILLLETPQSKSVLSATNDISAAFLACAAKGLFSSALVSFAQALAWSTTQSTKQHWTDYGRLDSALEAVCSLGHSSGMDVVSGFLFGLRT